MEYSIKDTQKIIERFAKNSFLIKGFSFTFLGLILPTVYEKNMTLLTVLAIISVVMFWYLDSYYLRMERIYRRIEQEGITKGLNYKNYEDIIEKECWYKVTFSITLVPIYIIQILFIIISCIG